MQQVVINTQYGGFGLSYAGMMAYMRLKKVKCYAYVTGRNKKGMLDFKKMVPYKPKKDDHPFCIHYYTKPYNPRAKKNTGYISDREIPRDDPLLIKVVNKLGKKAYGEHATLKIVEVPDGVKWQIEEYDGNEHIAEAHSTWS